MLSFGIIPRVKTIFNAIALLCLAAGLGGIVWCGDGRLLLALPVAFGFGLGRDAMGSMLRDCASSGGMTAQLPLMKVAFAIHVFLSFTLFFFTGAVIVRFTLRPDDLVWTKACWFAGLVLQPWFWHWHDTRTKSEAIAALALAILTAAPVALFPKHTDDITLLAAFAFAAVLVIVDKVLKRKGVSA